MKKLVLLLSLIINTIAFSQAITDTGTKVGIGTTNPTAALDIKSDSNLNWIFLNDGSGNNLGSISRSGNGLQLNTWSGGTSHLILNPNGNVGVGTLSPIVKFDIEGGDLYLGQEVSANGMRREIRVYGFDNNGKFYGSLHSNYDDNRRTFDINTNNQVEQIKIDVSSNAYGNIVLKPGTNGNVGIGTTTPSEKLEIRGGDGVGISLYNDQANYWDILNSQFGKLDFVRGKSNIYMRIDQSGNVGIGTTTPDSKLTIQGSVNIGGTGNHGLKTRHINGKSHENTNVDNLYLNYGIDKNVYVGAFNSGSPDSDLLVSGNIGIGTETPDAKLTVKGNIHTNEVKVDLLGAVAPDYVFYEDYSLKTLKEVEDYIYKEGHLPNIPSAQQMGDEGILLKEMNLKLLEKIEELTLYTINQEKRIITLEVENKKLKIQEERITQLEEKLESILKKN